MIFTGKHWWANNSKVIEGNVKEAIVRKNDTEIIIDCENGDHVKLNSQDGINFMGEYQRNGIKAGSCEFMLYKNKKGNYLLKGGYSDAEDETGVWVIELNTTKYVK
ncbi:MAG: hypothetical protein V1933_00035 [Candidatus Omnitrophota bacterium]